MSVLRRRVKLRAKSSRATEIRTKFAGWRRAKRVGGTRTATVPTKSEAVRFARVPRSVQYEQRSANINERLCREVEAPQPRAVLTKPYRVRRSNGVAKQRSEHNKKLYLKKQKKEFIGGI